MAKKKQVKEVSPLSVEEGKVYYLPVFFNEITGKWVEGCHNASFPVELSNDFDTALSFFDKIGYEPNNKQVIDFEIDGKDYFLAVMQIREDDKWTSIITNRGGNLFEKKEDAEKVIDFRQKTKIIEVVLPK